MAKEYFHMGTPYSTDPQYTFTKGTTPYGNFTGYRANFSSLSSAIDPRTANQIKEVSETLNTGIKNIEVGALQPDVFQSIPKEHFKEMNRMAKLAGAEISFHAPMIDPTGITEHGWNKLNQDSAEAQLWDAIKKSQELNPNGTVVTLHATSGFPGSAEMKMKDDSGKEKIVAMTVIDEATGKIGQIGAEKKRYFGSEGNEPIEFDAEKERKRINEDQWMNTLSSLNFASERAKSQLEHTKMQLNSNPYFAETKERIEDLEKKGQKDKAVGDMMAQQKKDYEQKENDFNHAKIFLREAYQNTKSLYDEVFEGATPEQKKKLIAYAKEVTPYANEFSTLEKDPKKLDKFAAAVEEGIKILTEIKPEIYKPIRQFAIEKSAETTANLAWKGFKEFEQKGMNAPIITLENHPAQQALLTTGDDLRDVVKKSREIFVNKAVQSGISQSEAEEQAEKLIGATWDVGHINMLRKYGFGEEEIVRQTKSVAPFIKKIHLADNFGLEHTEIPMGMGNVPIAAMMQEVQKGTKGYDIKKVIEAGNWWQHFSSGTKATGPLMPTLAGMGSPIYAGGYSPSNVGWNQMYGIPGGYFGGYGTMLPDQNFLTYGAGFTTLPTELGGQVANKDSRFSGTPMA